MLKRFVENMSIETGGVPMGKITREEEQKRSELLGRIVLVSSFGFFVLMLGIPLIDFVKNASIFEIWFYSFLIVWLIIVRSFRFISNMCETLMERVKIIKHYLNNWFE
jgi:hypothetical protein